MALSCKVSGFRVAMLTSAFGVAVAAAGPAIAQQQPAQPPASRPGTEWYRDNPAAMAPGQVAGQPPAQPAVAVAPGAPAAVGQPQPGVPQAPPLRPYQMPPLGNNYGGYGSTSGLYPSYEMNTYVVASARASMARALCRQAEAELGQAYRAAQRQFENSADYRQALKEERQAWDSLGSLRAKALESLTGDTKYNRLAALREDLSRQLEMSHVRRSLSQEEVYAMASLKMSYAAEMRAIEQGVLGSDADVRDAQARLVAAGAQVSAMRQAYDEAVRANPDILMARQNMADAVVARQTADAYLRAATANGAAALDYAYYLYRQPNRGSDVYGYR